jgi:hypothetical protein
VRFILVVLLGLGLVASCSPSQPPPARKEVCGNALDDDGDAKTDCLDPDCFGDAYCQQVVEDCANGIDDDRNGLEDCKDPACASAPNCFTHEVCDNERDDNGNGLVDCADPECRAQPFCGDGGVEAPAHCGDGVDNDNNGARDCRDRACAGLSCGTGCLCTDAGLPGEADCGDSVDNDHDQLTDCADPGCAGASCGPACLCQGTKKVETDCADGFDNDGDAQADCQDQDCANKACGTGCECRAALRVETACTDGADNDHDNLVDCADPDCANTSCGPGCQCLGLKKTELNCTDGVDNDGDSKLDCLDSPDCDGTACGTGCTCQGGAKHETLCHDHLDNDGDGLRDCADPADCSGALNGCGNGQPETTSCFDGLDNDNNGDRDCEDAACAAHTCGTGCECRLLTRAEILCSNGLDDDGDGVADCADADCVNVGTESSCVDQADNNCNGLVDCADTACAGTAACTALAIGRACSANAQCASGTCWLEGSTGWPSGACVAGVSTCARDAGVTVGCPAGSVCTSDEFGTFCRQQCSGSTGCRRGYACHDEDQDSSTPPWCVPLCVTDNDCAHLGGTYGCNPWSRRCETKNRGLKKYGEACSGDPQCETGRCLGQASGYCAGLCPRTGGSCATGGVCASDGTVNDGTNRCYDDCTSAADCRGSPYTCQLPPWGGPANACYCSRTGEKCAQDSDCCSRSPIGIPPACLFGFCTF